LIDLSGYRVLVTGGSRGIGAACCEAFAGAGAAVAIHYRADETAAERVESSLPAPRRGVVEHFRYAMDLRDPEGPGRLLSEVDSRWGGLDCLVNNAGIWRPNPLESFDPAELEETWQVNLRAPFLCAAAAVPLLRRSPHATIVNIASTAGQRGEAFHSPYAATKGAILAATRSWASELAPGIRVNAVAPGWVDTDMCIEPFAHGGKEKIAAGIALGRVATAEDIAGPVVFLASPLARHLTGSVVSVNGGGVMSS
jgi:3-oxoacyl-[acyl-carrier protein] reductase